MAAWAWVCTLPAITADPCRELLLSDAVRERAATLSMRTDLGEQLREMFAKIAEGFGVPATVATTCEELAEQFRRALAEPGPHLIDARIPTLF